MCAISTSGAVDATDGMLWCSATQKRRKPSCVGALRKPRRAGKRVAGALTGADRREVEDGEGHAHPSS